MLIVEKYGGSSVATTQQIKDIAKHIKKETEKGNKVVVVVSAMGKTTNGLISLSKEITDKPNLREMDILLSTGELQSVSLLSIALADIGVKAISLSGWQAGIVTNENFSKAFIKKIKISNVQKHLNENKVVIIAGFQGITEKGEITTLGRGGSDTTAVAIASALGCSCNIYTDVFAVCTTDPKILPNAKHLHQMTFDEMMELSVGGAKVLETRSVELAKIYNVDLYLGKSLEDDKTKGTKIMNKKNFEDVAITGIGIKENMTVFSVETNNFDYSEILPAFKVLEGNNLEMLTQTQKDDGFIFTFALPTEKKDFVAEALGKNVKLHTYDNLAKITVVGTGLATHSKIASKIFNTLSENGMKFFNISLSEISIAFTVEKENVNKVVHILARLFNL